MLENRAARWLLVSMVWLWGGFAVAEPPEVMANAPAAARAPAGEALEGMEPGVVIEEIPKGSTLEKAGLLVEDVITAWKRLPNPPANPEAAEGEMDSYFDWQELEVEQAPRGMVVLRGRRGSEPLELTVTPGLWEAKVRPVLSRVFEELYLAGKAQLASGNIAAAEKAWRLVANRAGVNVRGDLRPWIILRIGESWEVKGDRKKAVKECQEAIELAEEDSSRALAWEALGKIYEKGNDYGAAEEAYGSASKIRQKLRSESLGLASSLNRLGILTSNRGELDRAHDYYLQALQMRERLAPQSLQVANSLNNLGLLAFDRGQLDVARSYHLRAMQIREQLAPMSLEVAASLNNLGIEARARGQLQLASDYHLRALQIREELAPQSLVFGQSLTNLGELAWARGEFEDAHGYLIRALEIYDKVAPHSVDLAYVLINLGKLSDSRGELGRAQEYLTQALRIFEEVAPQSLDVAHSLNNLGSVAWNRGELDQAHDYLYRAMQIREQLAPGSLDLAVSLNNLGIVADARGDLGVAYDYFLRALQIRSYYAPDSLDLAASLSSLGNLAKDRGDLDAAYEYHRRALRICEKVSPMGESVAAILKNLGSVAQARGELSRAQEYFVRAQKIEEKLAPHSRNLAASLNNLGVVARDRGELDLAYNYHSRALRLKEQLVPGSLDVAYSLHNLGMVSQDRGQLRQAQDFFNRALRIFEEHAPRTIEAASALSNLGIVSQGRTDLRSAYNYHLKSLQILEQLAPQSLALSASLNHLGDVVSARGEVDHARDYYMRALAAFEHQVSMLGGSYTVQASFRVQHGDFYQDMLALLLAQGRLPEAFQILERFRAQTFLTMLAERDIAFTVDIPEELDRERRRIGVFSDRALRKLAGLNPRDHAEEIEMTRKELRRLDDEAGDIEARIRSASPRLAALRHPQPLDAAAAQQALDAGTLLVSFSVGKEHTTLFALSRGEALDVKTLPLGEEALRTRVKQFLSLLQEAKQDSSVGELRERRIESLGRELYAALLGPLAERIATSERLLILPDGPLHSLPFGALVHETKDGPQSLAAWKPLHVALSATVYAELKQRRRPAGGQDGLQAPLQLAAFGDPIYPQSLATLKSASPDVLPADGAIGPGRGDPTVRGAAERGLFDFQPLPYTRREVLGIASLFPEGTARTFLGPEALEERIKSLDPRTRILHLAAHGSTDEHLLSGSFIALTIPDETSSDDSNPQRDNGLLQVWEIFERVRLNADLVVLSACETGLGEELGGEGLIGLTRAFQYAGARSVLASLWSVNDQATSELMIRFYKHLLAGLPKDQALQAAQQELIAAPIEVLNEKGEREVRDFSAPFYWAGFQLYGDWQ